MTCSHVRDKDKSDFIFILLLTVVSLTDRGPENKTCQSKLK